MSFLKRVYSYWQKCKLWEVQQGFPVSFNDFLGARIPGSPLKSHPAIGYTIGNADVNTVGNAVVNTVYYGFGYDIGYCIGSVIGNLIAYSIWYAISYSYSWKENIYILDYLRK